MHHAAETLEADKEVVHVAVQGMDHSLQFAAEDAKAVVHTILRPRNGNPNTSTDMDTAADCAALVAVIELGELPPAFRLRHRLLGDRGRFVHHIQDVTRAKVWCKGSPLKIHTSAFNDESLDKAVRLARHLVDTVAQQYDLWRKKRG